MPNKNKMKSLNLSGSQAEIVVKSLNERLYEFDEELDALESRIIEIRMKKSQLNNLLAELGGTPTSVDGPKKRGRKPGTGKKAVAETAPSAPKKRGRKPGTGKKAETAASGAPQKRGRKPGTAKKSATPKKATAASQKRGRKPGKKGAAPTAAPKKGASKIAAKKATPKAVAPKKAAKKAAKKSAPVAPKKAVAKAAPSKKAESPKVAAKGEKAAAKAPAKKAEAAGKRGRKAGGENTLASKIVSAIKDAKKGLSTREIVDSINTRYGAEKDERKLIQAVSSTLISLTKRGKIKRENSSDGQILNIVVS